MSSAIFFVSGRTRKTIAAETVLIPAAASQGTVNSLASSCLPANSGLKTVGPRIAPNTEPKRTNEIPRARRCGGDMSPAAGPAGGAGAPRRPGGAEATADGVAAHGWGPRPGNA